MGSGTELDIQWASGKGELAELQTIVLCVNITESILLPERSGARLSN